MFARCTFKGALRGTRSVTDIMKALKCKPSAQFAYSYSINILNKYSSLISHRPSMFEGRHIRLSIFEGRHINERSSKVDTSIIGLWRSTHPSPKVDTSIFESRHIDLQRSTHRDIDLRRATHRSSKIEGGNIRPTIHRWILSTTALLSPWNRRSDTRSYVHV